VCATNICNKAASPFSNESQSDRPTGNTSNSHKALSHTVVALLCSPTVLACVGVKPSSFVIRVTFKAGDSIRKETVYVCIVRLYGTNMPVLAEGEHCLIYGEIGKCVQFVRLGYQWVRSFEFGT